MAFDFSKNTQSNILQTMLQKISNSLDKREGSLIYTALAPISWLASQIYLLLQSIQDNAYIETAYGSGLDMICAGRGISRKEAVKAVRLCYFDIEVGLDKVFSTLNGDNSLDFTTTKFIEQREDGYYYYQATCQTAGIEGNGYEGSIAASTYIQGLKVAQMTEIIINGSGEEDDESLRQRYLDSLQEKPFGGNLATYKTEITNIDGVGGVQVYPFWKGGGTVLCSIITTDYEIAHSGLIEKVQNEICPPESSDEDPSINGYGIAPIGALVTITTPTALKINVKAQALPRVGYTIGEVNTAAKTNIEAYLLSLRKAWANRVSDFSVKYTCNILIAQITAAILDYEGILNLRELTVNDGTEDIELIETSELQELPILNEVIITEMAN